jgi:hypothetical protein
LFTFSGVVGFRQTDLFVGLALGDDPVIKRYVGLPFVQFAHFE